MCGPHPPGPGDYDTPAIKPLLDILTINDVNCLSDVSSLANGTLLRLLEADPQAARQMNAKPELASDRQFLTQNVERLWLGRGGTGRVQNLKAGLAAMLQL